jgi:hypothetical protein
VDFIKIQLPNCTLLLTEEELECLLQKDMELYSLALERGKEIEREIDERDDDRWDWEGL